MILIDLYSRRYTGELEAILIEKDSSDNILFQVKLFQADFSVIVDWIPYDAASSPDNLALILNTNLDWGEDFSEVIRLQEFYHQLLLVINYIDPNDLEVFNSIRNICESTIQNGNRLFIKLYN